ncbi:MAG: serine protease [Kiritimatiellae bacterium]|nr:serine protease [Kiritimatiellia bacterium]
MNVAADRSTLCAAGKLAAVPFSSEGKRMKDEYLFSRVFAVPLVCSWLIGRAHSADEAVRVDSCVQDQAALADDACAIVAVRDAEGREIKQGSGFFVNSNGWFVTAYHVIEGGYNGWIRTRDGRQHAVLNVINVWPRGDLAVLATGCSNTKWLAVADPRETAVGMDLTLLGAPDGAGWSRTSVKVQAIVEEFGVRLLQYAVSPARQIPASVAPMMFHPVVTVEAPASSLSGTGPGSSGAPVFDAAGRVHAVHSKWQPQQLLGRNGQWQLSWSPPKIRGVHSSEVIRLLSAPLRPTPMSRLGSMANDAFLANVLLATCAITDPILRDIRSAMGRAQTITRSKDVRREVIGVGGQRYTTVSESVLVAPPDVSIKMREFEWLQWLLESVLAARRATDPQLQKALEHWRHTHGYLQRAIESVGAGRRGSPSEIDAALDHVRTDFKNANDSMFFALEAAWVVWQRYSGWSTQPALFEEGVVRAAQQYYRECRLEL